MTPTQTQIAAITLPELEAAVKNADKEHRLTLAGRQEARTAAIAAVDEQFRERLDHDSEALAAAKSARDAFKSESGSHPWLGKKVYRVQPIYARYGAGVVGETRFDGIVEVRRINSTFAENLGNYAIPALGEAFVRILKKNGTTGIKIERVARGIESTWKLADD